MAILSTIKKIRPYIKTATGYIKLKLFADDVVTNKGTTVEDELNTINTNLTNYIVEEKTTNLGTYRKWSNGTLEMWGRQELTECHLNIVNGGIVLSNGYTIQLPYTSVSIITGVSLCFRSTGAIWVSESTGGNNKDTIGFWLIGGVQTRINGGLEFRCTGTWK